MKSLLYFTPLLAGICEAAAMSSAMDPPMILSDKRDTCLGPQSDSCAFYPDCLETRYQCGPEGYPIGYGLHYCSLFDDSAPDMSDAGRQWIDDTRLCLQDALVPYTKATAGREGEGESAATCDEIREFAFATHPACYVDSGVCTLPATDWGVIVRIVSLRELFGSWEALKATLQTAGRCGSFYLWLIKQGIVDVIGGNKGFAVGDAAGEAVWDSETSWA